jgi:hypothetical protein
LPISAQFLNRHRKTENFICAGFLAADVDDSMTLEEALDHGFVQHHGGLIHTTASHTEARHRLRIVFLLDEAIVTARDWADALLGLAVLLGSDQSVADAARLFYGNSPAEIVPVGKTMAPDVVANLIASGRAARASRSPIDLKRRLPVDSVRRIAGPELIKVAGGNLVRMDKSVSAPALTVLTTATNDPARSRRGPPLISFVVVSRLPTVILIDPGPAGILTPPLNPGLHAFQTIIREHIFINGPTPRGRSRLTRADHVQPYDFENCVQLFYGQFLRFSHFQLEYILDHGLMLLTFLHEGRKAE